MAQWLGEGALSCEALGIKFQATVGTGALHPTHVIVKHERCLVVTVSFYRNMFRGIYSNSLATILGIIAVGHKRSQGVLCYPLQGSGLPSTPLDAHSLEVSLCWSQLQAIPVVFWGPELGFSYHMNLLEFLFSALGFLRNLQWQKLRGLSCDPPELGKHLCVHFGVILGFSKRVASFTSVTLGRDSVLGAPQDEGFSPTQHSRGLWKGEGCAL